MNAGLSEPALAVSEARFAFELAGAPARRHRLGSPGRARQREPTDPDRDHRHRPAGLQFAGLSRQRRQHPGRHAWPRQRRLYARRRRRVHRGPYRVVQSEHAAANRLRCAHGAFRRTGVATSTATAEVVSGNRSAVGHYPGWPDAKRQSCTRPPMRHFFDASRRRTAPKPLITKERIFWHATC